MVLNQQKFNVDNIRKAKTPCSTIIKSMKKQTVIPRSTAEAEYIATTECTKKVLWTKNILYELFKIKKSIKIFTDNLTRKNNNRKR